jgi:chromosome segregation ATPase
MAENAENTVVEREFEQEDIDTVKSLQSGYARTTAQIGQVEIELHLLNKRLDQMKNLRERLFNEYTELQTKESDLVKTLNEKYGDGVLDLDSGKFIASKS